MNFEFDGETYRVERGEGTGAWLLLHCDTLGHGGWKLLGAYPAMYKDEEIIPVVLQDLA